MVLEQMSTFFKEHPWRKNAVFTLMLVILEKVVEHVFMCPCRRGYTEVLFCFYLLMPMLMAILFGFYLLSPEFWKGSGREESPCTKIKKGILKFLAFITRPLVWVALFLSDGRYMSCLRTELKAEYADSNEKPPWEWCSKSRNLTDDQNRVHNWFYYFKFSGFLLLFLILVVALIFKKCKEEDAHESNTQPDPAGQPMNTLG